MAIGMAISILVKVLLPSSGGVAVQGKSGGDEKPENVKDWLRNKLKALASLLGRLGVKVAEPLPGFIAGIWIVNRVKEVVSSVSQNLFALVVGEGCFVCTWSGESNVISIMEMTFCLPSTTRLLQFWSCSKQ